MATDDELLSEFRSGSSAAFSELMSRHVDWVYSAALRRVGDSQLAEDVTQAVFLALARKPGLPNGAALAGWLFTVMRYTSAGANRERTRRRLREAAAAKLRPEMIEDQIDWSSDVAPMLEDAVGRLRLKDRQAVLLRFYQKLSFAEVGKALGTSEEAARKRVTRAVDKLRAYFVGKGIALSSATLAAEIFQHVVQKAPETVIAKMGAASLTSGGTAQLLAQWLRHTRRQLWTKIAAVAGATTVAAALVVACVLPRSNTVTVHRSVNQRAISLTALKWQPKQQGRFVSSGAIDNQGRIWIASEEDGVFVNEGGQWKHFTPADGLGGLSVYAVACDSLGRVWVGHNRNGISVFNGEKWKNFDAADGPLGSHVSYIKVCPTSAPRGGGDVWMASELGLARYSIASNTWSYFTRAEGLPSDQVSGLDFDSQGNLYLGTRCDGLAVARASDDYKYWRAIRGATQQPPAETGDGLPSNNINAVLVARGGAIFVATDHGLARSTDDGNHWTFFRGKDWIAKLKGSINGPPPDWSPRGSAILAEDYIAALAEDQNNLLWIGYRTKGYQCLDEKTLQVLKANQSKGADYCDMILPIPGGTALLGTRGSGLVQVGGSTSPSIQLPRSESEVAPEFPLPAAAPTAQDLERLTERVKSSGDSTNVAALLGEDWVTQGDWVGRYGQQQSYWPPGQPAIIGNTDYLLADYKPCTGPHNQGQTFPWNYFRDKADTRCLYVPSLGRRMQGEWNDGGYREAVFGPNWEGPDLWFDVTVPAGVHRVTVYIHNIGNNNGTDRRRDNTIELRHYVEGMEQAQRAPVLADDRVEPSQNPAYHTFLVSEGRYWIRVASNYSQMVSVQALFFDRADFTGPDSVAPAPSYMNGISCNPPQPAPGRANDSAQLRSARALWAALDAKYAAAPALQMPYRMQAFRAALAADADRDLLANWRWNLHLWTPQDRAQWEKLMAEARKRLPSPATQPTIE
jgi:RNA polymerase sigma factor (sigma-70 family)